MNLVTCSAHCAYQKEGFCTIEKLSATRGVPPGDCIYYRPGMPAVPLLSKQPADIPDSSNPK